MINIWKDTGLIYPGDIVCIYVDIPDCCKYVPDCYDQCTRTCD